MGAKLVVDQTAARGLLVNAAVIHEIETLGQRVLDKAYPNVPYNAARTEPGPHLRDTGFVEAEGNTVRVGYTADYAAIAHEGEGTHKGKGRRPFLANAITQVQGEERGKK